MFNGSADLRKFQQRKCNKSRKIPIFCRKTLRNGIELRQDRYLNMRRLSNLLPLGNLSHGVFFSVDLFFRRPMNITGAVAGNPRFHHIKAILCYSVFNTPS